MWWTWSSTLCLPVCVDAGRQGSGHGVRDGVRDDANEGSSMSLPRCIGRATETIHTEHFEGGGLKKALHLSMDSNFTKHFKEIQLSCSTTQKT